MNSGLDGEAHCDGTGQSVFDRRRCRPRRTRPTPSSSTVTAISTVAPTLKPAPVLARVVAVSAVPAGAPGAGAASTVTTGGAG